MPDNREMVLGKLGRALGDFSMLRPGDRVAVGVSGGKDSLCLVHALAAWRHRAPFPYEVSALTVDQGKFTAPVDRLKDVFRDLGIPWTCRPEPRTRRLVEEGVEHGCDVCSRHRRGALYEIADELSCTVLALGHTADDCSEALFRNVLFNGRIASLPPVAPARKGPIRVIRPLVYVSEEETSRYVAALGMPTIGCVCGDRDGPRRQIRQFLEGLSRDHSGIRESLTAALGNVAPFTLFDPGLRKAGGDPPAFAEPGEGALRGTQTPE
jgi:tRNA 2-thiocytidine biosynthesis protein TtcA